MAKQNPELGAIPERGWNIPVVSARLMALDLGGFFFRQQAFRDSSDYNQALSSKRAEMVAAYLRSGGVSKISTTAVGQKQPAVSTADGQPEQKNRRVEIQFVR